MRPPAGTGSAAGRERGALLLALLLRVGHAVFGPLFAWALVIGGLPSGRPGDTEQEHRSDCGDRDQDDEEK